MSNVYVHPTINNPAALERLQQRTGMVAIPSHDGQRAVLVVPENSTQEGRKCAY